MVVKVFSTFFYDSSYFFTVQGLDVQQKGFVVGKKSKFYAVG